MKNCRDIHVGGSRWGKGCFCPQGALISSAYEGSEAAIVMNIAVHVGFDDKLGEYRG